MKNNRVFLKKCKVDNIHLKDLYVGNSINLMSRLLDVVDYADSYTRRMLSPETEKCSGVSFTSACIHLPMHYSLTLSAFS